MANPTITINATGITVSGPLIAGEPVAVTASGLSLPEGAALTLALSSRAPNALLASCVLAESEETPGTWTGTLETASRQMAVYFATAAADDTRPAVLELVETTTRDSLALLVTSIRNSALIPSSSPCAVAPVYLPIPGPPGDPQPSDAYPLIDGAASPGISADYSRSDHQHPTDTSRMAATATGVDIIVQPTGQWGGAPIATFAAIITERVNDKQDSIEDLAAIRSGAAEGATAVQPAALSAYRPASAQDAIDDVQTERIGVVERGVDALDRAVQTIGGMIPSTASSSNKLTTADDLSCKQDTITDLAAIRSGAAAGATAYQKPASGIPAGDLTIGVKASLDKADTAVQPASPDFTGIPTAPTAPAGTNTTQIATTAFVAGEISDAIGNINSALDAINGEVI